MTRARPHTSGVGNQPLIQPLLEAVLCALVMIVSNVAAMFGMGFNHRRRDWHTTDAQEVLPQTRPDIQFRENSGTASRRLAVNAQRQTQTLTQITSRATHTRQEADKVRVPGEGRGPVLRAAQTRSHRSALTRAHQTYALILSVSKDAGDSADGVVRLKSA
jgi:hypothetical protein